MNFSKFALSLLLISMPFQISAGLSWFSLSAWMQAAKKQYYWMLNREQMFEKRTKLERLYRIRTETDTLNKMWWVVGKAIPVDQLEDWRLVEGLKSDEKALNRVFLKKQCEWSLQGEKTLIHDLIVMDAFKSNVLEPAIKKAEEENLVPHSELALSWYEQVKERERNLPEGLRKKTKEEAAQELAQWQQKNGRTKLELSQESKELQAKLNARIAKGY